MAETRHELEVAGCLHEQRAEAEEPEELLERKAGMLTALAAQAKLADPTDEILLSPNRTPGWPKGNPSGVTLHTEEGFHDASVALLRSPSSQASAHFCVRRDGHITQLVWERDRAWHALSGNDFYFGIEHEGSAFPDETGVPMLWKTAVDAKELDDDDRMLIESARLVAYLSVKYDIPIQHDFRLVGGVPRRDTESRIAGHDQMAGNDHRDPGPKFPWKAYISKVKELAGKA